MRKMKVGLMQSLGVSDKDLKAVVKIMLESRGIIMDQKPRDPTAEEIESMWETSNNKSDNV